MKKADAILCGDIHLTDKTPACRVDDYKEALWGSIDFIEDLCDEHDCYALMPGDIFNESRSPQAVESKAITHMPSFVAIPGQHDLLHHNINWYEDCSLCVLDNAREDCVVLTPDFPSLTLHDDSNSIKIDGFWWQAPLMRFDRDEKESYIRKIAMVHTLVWHGSTPWPGAEADSAMRLLKEMSQYDLILTGDNHQSFVVRHKNRLLVNCGSMMRSSADQADHKPFVCLYYADTNEIEKVYLPIKKGVISREHIEEAQAREQRKETYVQKFKANETLGLNLENRVEEGLKLVERQEVKEIILASLD